MYSATQSNEYFHMFDLESILCEFYGYDVRYVTIINQLMFQQLQFMFQQLHT